MRGDDDGTADRRRGERHGPDDLLERELCAQADREHGAERFPAQQQRQRARGDETVQHPGQADVPKHVRVEEIQTGVDGRGRREAHAPPIGVAEHVRKQRADDGERGEIRPQVTKPQVHEMARHEAPVLAAFDGLTLVTPELAELVAARGQCRTNCEDRKDRPPAPESQDSDAGRP